MNYDVNGKKEKTVVLVNRAMYLPGEGGYKRTMYLYDMMRKLGHKPILLTSDFNHYKKARRNISEFKMNHPDYSDIVFLHTRTYNKNISLRRRLAETDWKNAVAKWVRDNAKDIDVIMLSMPDMNTILAVSDICNKNDISIVIDVRDLRPEAFKVLLKKEILYRIITYPMKIKADKAYSCADKLFAVSEEYLQRGIVPDSHATVKKTIYIGADLERFDDGISKYANSINKPSNELWISYVGTLGTSYDIDTVIDAVGYLKDKSFNGKTIMLMVLGQGPDREAFEEHAYNIGADNVSFLGFMEYEKMAAFLSKSDMTINAIKRRGSQSIINKIADYFAAGIPVLNGCACEEQQAMIIDYNVGYNYEPENVDSLVDAIIALSSNDSLRKEMGNNARQLALDKFDRKKTYSYIIDELYN